MVSPGMGSGIHFLFSVLGPEPFDAVKKQTRPRTVRGGSFVGSSIPLLVGMAVFTCTVYQRGTSILNETPLRAFVAWGVYSLRTDLSLGVKLGWIHA